MNWNVDAVKADDIERLRRERDELLSALRRIVTLDDDAHPGLFTWCQFRAEAHQQALRVLAKHAKPMLAGITVEDAGAEAGE